MSDDPKITSLVAAVKAAQQEIDMAVMFHEVWKPTAYDDDLRKRMGVSYATNTFRVVRVALRREMLLALMRLWDKDKRAVGMHAIARSLDDRVIGTLAEERVRRLGVMESKDKMEDDMRRLAKEATDIIEYYSDGPGRTVLENPRSLRNQHLAHRQIAPASATGADATDDEIETFYQKNSKLVSALLSLIAGIGYDPQEAAEVHRFYANFFWAGVRGERTEEHPNYRASAPT